MTPQVRSRIVRDRWLTFFFPLWGIVAGCISLAGETEEERKTAPGFFLRAVVFTVMWLWILTQIRFYLG